MNSPEGHVGGVWSPIPKASLFGGRSSEIEQTNQKLTF